MFYPIQIRVINIWMFEDVQIWFLKLIDITGFLYIFYQLNLETCGWVRMMNIVLLRTWVVRSTGPHRDSVSPFRIGLKDNLIIWTVRNIAYIPGQGNRISNGMTLIVSVILDLYVNPSNDILFHVWKYELNKAIKIYICKCFSFFSILYTTRYNTYERHRRSHRRLHIPLGEIRLREL